MNLVKVEVVMDSFEVLKSQAVTGIVYFDFGDYQFPEKNWNDFVVVILNWWLCSLTKIVSKESDLERLRFMEGQLYLNVESIEGGFCEITCYNGEKRINLNCKILSCIELLKSVVNAAKIAIDFCEGKGSNLSDINDLKNSYQRSKLMVKNYEIIP